MDDDFDINMFRMNPTKEKLLIAGLVLGGILLFGLIVWGTAHLAQTASSAFIESLSLPPAKI